MSTDDCPQLREWLAKHNARCQWSGLGTERGSYIEQWLINGRPLIVVLYPKRHGWDLFTQVGGETTMISETLAEAEGKLGLNGASQGTPLIYSVRSEVECGDGLLERDTWHVAAFTPEQAVALVRAKVEEFFHDADSGWRIKLISVNATMETARRLPR